MDLEEYSGNPGVREWTCGCATSTGDGYVYRDCTPDSRMDARRLLACVRRGQPLPKRPLRAS